GPGHRLPLRAAPAGSAGQAERGGARQRQRGVRAKLRRAGGRQLVRRGVALLAVLLCVACAGRPPQPVSAPAGCLAGAKRGGVPASIAGGRVVDTQQLAALMQSRPVLVDVAMPIRRPDTIPEGTWVPPPHHTLPGSVWLPGVGKGVVTPVVDMWYRAR